MTKKKVTLAYISNDASRRLTFNKRKKGLFKKMKELSILCRVKVSAVITSPSNQTPAEMWPSDSEVKKTVEKFEIFTDTDPRKKVMSQKTFFVKCFSKFGTKAVDWRIKELSMKEMLYQCLDGNREIVYTMSNSDLSDFMKFVTQYKQALNVRASILKNLCLEQGESSLDAGADVVPSFQAILLTISQTSPRLIKNLQTLWCVERSKAVNIVVNSQVVPDLNQNPNDEQVSILDCRVDDLGLNSSNSE